MYITICKVKRYSYSPEALDGEAAVWISIEMAALLLIVPIISLQLSGLFLVSVRHYPKNLHVIMSSGRSRILSFTKVKMPCLSLSS